MKTVTSIALHNVRHSKTRSLLIVIAIFLTTFLLTVIGLGGVGVTRHNIKNVGLQTGNYHAAFLRVGEEKLKEIRQTAGITDIGLFHTFAQVENHDIDGHFSYADEKAVQMANSKLESGTMPVEKNEIAGQRSFFACYGSEGNIGDTVTIPYRVLGKGKILEKEFVISGLIPDNETADMKKAYRVYLSESFYKAAVEPSERSYLVCFKIAADDMNADQIQEYIKQLAFNLDIDEKSMEVNKMYITWSSDPGTETILFCVVIAFVVILFSSIVIYNIFHVGIIQKIQEFGKLRAIGSTKKQLRGIILREGLILSLAGIPAGLLCGSMTAVIGFDYLMSFISRNIIIYEEVSVISLPVILLAAGISLLTVYISLRRPMKTASLVSPVEAIKYQEESSKKAVRKGYETVNVMRLTMSNMARNKKRTVVTILTMGLSCVLFVITANIAGGLDPSYDARRYIEKGDFQIELDYTYKDDAYPENELHKLQQIDLLSEELIQKIKAIDGVTKVEKRGTISAENNKEEFPYEDERQLGITILNREEFADREKNLKRGEISYDKAVKENGILFTYDHALETYYMQIGEEIPFTVFDGEKRIPFSGKLIGSMDSLDASFIMAEDTWKTLGMKENVTTKLYIFSEQGKLAQVEEQLNELIGAEEKLYLSSYENALEVAKMQIELMRVPAYIFLAVLGIIGFMNMANTLITSSITRKKEFGILQAVGMTRKQLNTMLQAEGFVFTIGTMAVSLTLGNIIGYALFVKFKSIGFFGLNVYHLPVAELAVMILALIFLQIFLSYSISRIIQKEAVIDRIRYE